MEVALSTILTKNCRKRRNIASMPPVVGATPNTPSVLQQVLDRATSRGFTPYYYDLDVLAENAQYKLFHHSCQEGHCLIQKKPRRPGTMRLRTRGHKFQLPTIMYKFNKSNFIVRSCFNYL